MNAQRVLIVDREQPKVQKLASMLELKGYQATGTDCSQPLPNELEHNHFDLVAFGQQISQSTKQSYEATLRRNNPALIAVTGMCPAVPVLADQVSMALDRKKTEVQPVTYINYDINEGCLAVLLQVTRHCDAEISIHRIGLFYGATEQVLFSAKLAPGERFIRFSEKALSGFGAQFMVIRIDGKVFYMQRL